jgi:hypothetical protein
MTVVDGFGEHGRGLKVAHVFERVAIFGNIRTAQEMSADMG